jgi:hypothetical protein
LIREFPQTELRRWTPGNKTDIHGNVMDQERDYIYRSGKVDGEKNFVLMLTGHGEPSRKPE